MDSGTHANTAISKRKSLVNELSNPVYRHAFTEAHAKDTIAFQINAMRESRGWTQGQLAIEAFGDQKLQSMISRYEDPDYGKYSISTLLNLAKVFDVGLVVRFAPFSEVVDWDLSKSGPTLDPPPFAKDAKLEEPKKTAENTNTAVLLIGYVPTVRIKKGQGTDVNFRRRRSFTAFPPKSMKGTEYGQISRTQRES
jgi:hypothetical protein